MKLDITYERALEAWPNLVDEVVHKLRQGKSKQRNASPSDMKWSLEWAQMIPGGGFNLTDIISGRVPRPAPKPETAEGRWEQVRQNIGASLAGSIGRWWWSVKIQEVPEEIRNQYITKYEEDIAEEHRVAGLTDEERDAETEALLNQLRGPGFMELRIPLREEGE